MMVLLTNQRLRTKASASCVGVMPCAPSDLGVRGHRLVDVGLAVARAEALEQRDAASRARGPVRCLPVSRPNASGL